MSSATRIGLMEFNNMAKDCPWQTKDFDLTPTLTPTLTLTLALCTMP